MNLQANIMCQHPGWIIALYLSLGRLCCGVFEAIFAASANQTRGTYLGLGMGKLLKKCFPSRKNTV
jgi:hypothetical protein